VRLAVLIALLFILPGVGCSKPRQSKPSRQTATTDPVTSLPQFLRKSRLEVESESGQPARTDRYPMSMAAGVMRQPLLKTYPPSDPANANVIIEESWWKDGDYWITLWFHQVGGRWVVLDTCRWRKDMQF
jgi:hypothetical protein